MTAVGHAIELKTGDPLEQLWYAGSMKFSDIMQLESHGPDVWVGVGPQYPWGGLYGGQIVAQGLRAAANTVEPGFLVHSIHAYFIRPGDQDCPVRYEVDRIRNGRSFVTRRVIARQSSGAIFNMSASFHVPEEEASLQTIEPRKVPASDTIENTSWSPAFERRTVSVEALGEPGAVAWCRIADELPDDPLLHACGLAYVSDDLPTKAVAQRHPLVRDNPDKVAPGVRRMFWNASLDHAIWFHHPVKADGFHLYQFACHALHGARGLSIGHVFDGEGKHLATVSQEVLLRLRRDKDS